MSVPRATLRIVTTAVQGSRVYAPGETIFAQGDAASNLLVVMSGLVTLTAVTSNGRERIVGTIGPGEAFGEPLPDGRHSAAARASEKTTVVEFRSSDPMAKALIRRLSRATDDIRDLMLLDTRARIAKKLVAQSRLTSSQEELAMIVGCSRETVNRTLSDFSSRGWLRMHAGRPEILDPHALLEQARG